MSQTVYVKSLKEFNLQIMYFNMTTFHREVLDNKGNSTGWVEIKIASNHKFQGGSTVVKRVRKLSGGWYEN